MTKKAVLFDLDNTLTHRNRSISSFVETFVAEYGNRLIQPQTSEIVSTIIRADNGGYLQQKSLFHSIKDLISHTLLFQLRWADRPSHDEIREFWKEFMPKSSVSMDGVPEIFSKLRVLSFMVGVVSNGAQGSRESVINALNIEDQIDTLDSSGEVGIKKPDPKIFNFTLEKLDIKSSNTWFVGDHPINDVIGSQDAGLRPIWMSGFHEWPEGYETPQYAIGSLDEIFEIVC